MLEHTLRFLLFLVIAASSTAVVAQESKTAQEAAAPEITGKLLEAESLSLEYETPKDVESAVNKKTDSEGKADNQDEEVESEEEYEWPSYFDVFEGLEPGEINETDESVKRRLPVVVEETVKPGKAASDDTYKALKFYGTYDKGFAILPYNKKKTPFDLRINGWIQFRHHGFTRDVESWTDNAGVTREVRNRNAFDIERARIYFKGTALDPRLSYFYHLDGDTDGRHGVDFFDYWWSWKFSDRFRLVFGKRKVTASRQWLLGARRTRFVDRPMANDFFRPDRTVGIFGLGKLGRSNFEFTVGNGYRTSNFPNNATDDQFSYAATQYWDVGGEYGGQLVDYDYACQPIFRFGHSFVYSPITSDRLGNPNNETDFLRLTDGTRLNQVGALAPGVTVSGVNVLYYGLDFGMKYRGWSFNSEVFLRWLDDFEADGALPVANLMQHGFYVEGGRFLIPKKLDLNFRYSEVDGLYGEGTEVAAGVNWYPLETFKLKCSFDVSVYDGSPLNNTTSDILVGDDGTLFRTQIQAEF
jgi:hypothetical protein